MTAQARKCYNCNGQGAVFPGVPGSREPDTRRIITCPICKGEGAFRGEQMRLPLPDEYLPLRGQN